MIDIYIIIILFISILYYSIAKERSELGCYRISIGRQCNDDESVYVKNTKMEKNDNCQDLLDRLGSILSYHEKGGVWRRCLVIATLATIVIYLVYSINLKFDNVYYYLILLLLIFTLLYFYHNYINYHHFRRLKNNGIEILNEIKKKCYK
jgi:uncharacterized membrane protein